jgi:hypothetical protein
VVPGAGSPQALNRYVYALNNPLKSIDPSGISPKAPRTFPATAAVAVELAMTPAVPRRLRFYPATIS